MGEISLMPEGLVYADNLLDQCLNPQPLPHYHSSSLTVSFPSSETCYDSQQDQLVAV